MISFNHTQTLDNLQFNIEEELMLPSLSPAVIDVSSDSGDEFIVQPGDLPEIEDRFRPGGPRSDVMTAFMGAATASLFPTPTRRSAEDEIRDISGTRIERQLVDLMEEDQHDYESPPTSFIDTELEDSPMSPWESPNRVEGSTNSYGRPTAAILPTPRDNTQRSVPVNRPAATYPPNFVANANNFQMPPLNVSNNHQQTIYPSNYNQQEIITPTNMNPPMAENMVVYNNAPLMIQIPPIGGRMDIPLQAPVTNNQHMFNFPFNVEHSSNLLLIPTSERQMHRLFPTVMPHVAGFCDWCGKCYDQKALEILGEYLIATAYDAETVRDRGVRSHAILDGFEAALFSFKSAGLSQPHSCAGAVGQQP